MALNRSRWVIYWAQWTPAHGPWVLQSGTKAFFEIRSRNSTCRFIDFSDASLQFTPITRSRCATPDVTTPATYAHIADLKQRLSSGQYTLRDKRGRSKVWQLFAVIVDENGDDIENFVACRNCYNVHKFHLSTSNLMKHKCALKLESLVSNSEAKTAPGVPMDEDTIKKVLGAVTAWSVYNCRPPSIVEDSEFENLVAILLNIGATYGENVKIKELLPQPTAVARNISDIYERQQRSLLEELMAIRATGYTMSMYIYTDKFRERHAVLTMHYIQESAVINRLLSVATMGGDLPAGGRISSKTINKLKET